MSSRPVSGKTRPGTATRTGDINRTLKNGDVVSYEDLLVAQYLEELKRSQPYTKNTAKTAPSPYLQRLSGSRPTSSHVIPATKRPTSAHIDDYSSKPKIDPKFIADPELWDPATPREHTHKHRRSQSAKHRPISAPAYKRPFSSSTYSSVGSRPASAKYGSRRNKPLYKRQPYTIVVLAFRNGCRDAFAKLAAPSIKVMLEMATDKLGLPSAGRRVFLDDGTEVFTPREIPRDSEVYVSCGEPFKDPLKPVKQHSSLTRDCAWTMNGLIWTQDNKRKSPKTKMSRRFRSLIEQSRRRVLVFKNGVGTNGVEIVADPERFEDFLVACTAKCELGSYARVLYDWNGDEIQNLEEAPILDKCLQTWSTPVLGPLWVSKGEGFSPKGVFEFLTGLIKYTQAKQREAKHYKTQLQYGQHYDTKHKVEIVAILSMTEAEIDETIEIVNKDVEDFSNALNRLEEQKNKIQTAFYDEEEQGHKYKMKHIREVQPKNRIVGKKGLKLKVYENGCYDDETVVFFNLHFGTRGAKDKKEVMARFLDECSSSTHLSNPKKNPQIRPVARKIFNETGTEITDIFELEYEQEIWLSYGEAWKNPFTNVVSVQVDQVRLYELEEEHGYRKTGVREQLMGEEIQGQEKAFKWEAVHGVPDDCEFRTVARTNVEEMESVKGLLEMSEIHVHDLALLRNKEFPKKSLLYPELTVEHKKKKGSKDVWPLDAQSFLICENGFIKNKAFPNLVLTVKDREVKKTLCRPTKGPTSIEVEGFMVGFGVKRGDDPDTNQMWEFTNDGLITPRSNPNYFLTYLGLGQDQPEQSKCFLCIAPKIEGKMVKAQRFALKQERFDNIGQWKFTRVENPEWNKRALSWPLTEEGQVNTDYDWPMEGYLLPYAPPLAKPEVKSNTNAGQVSLRLIVLKNGVRDISKAVPVVGPDLTNMKKDTQNKKKNKKNKKQSKEIETEQEDEELSVLKLEFILFLERCTSLLSLPFAARRLFDETGKEHFSLVHLTRDQLAYVSCGEAWTDPTLSKAEQQRRFLLSNLAGDVQQIRHFVTLRHADNLVLQVADSLTPGSPLCVNECALNPERDEQEEREAQMMEEEREKAMEEKRRMRQEMDMLVNQKMSAHDRSHLNADDRMEKLKWPWERIINRDIEEDEDPEAQHFSNKEMYRKFRPKKKRQDEGTLQLQKFIYDDNRIVCSGNFDLVLGVRESESGRGEVVLVKRRPDDIMQCWNMQPNGVIQCKNNPALVLTVTMPSSLADDEPGTYVGCQVQAQRRKTAQFGRANQRWYYDEASGMIQAFHTDLMDKQITAANRANVCTFAVMGTEEIDQPGYVAEIQVEKGAKPKRLLVCSSCARSMRGRHKLEKVTDNIDFACAMGSAKEHGVKQVGSFQCLNGKVDLSQYEAEHTLQEWEDQLDRLKDELSVRAIAKEISAARAPYTVKVLAYKNGDGRLKPGEVIVSSSIPGMLEQASGRLDLAQAARRVYTRDGTLTLDVDDLVQWAREQYVKDARKQMRAERRAKRLAEKKDIGEKEGGSLMDKVEFDSEESSGDEEDEEETPEPQEETRASSTDSEYVLGYEVHGKRANTDQFKNTLIVPNPEEPVEKDSVIKSWRFYANTPGRICFFVFRRDEADGKQLHVADLAVYTATQVGEHEFDCSKDPMGALEGDILGFMCLDGPMIPFDIDESAQSQHPLYQLLETMPQVGSPVPVEAWVQNGVRQYSLFALLEPVKPEKVERPKPESRPKTAKHAKSAKKKKGPYVEPPPMDMVLRYPIEVWVSCGENFVEPERVETDYERRVKFREERAQVSYELDKERHILRQMQGRRFDKQAPGELKGTSNPSQPVYKQGHWQETTLDELQKHDAVHQLQSHLSEVKANQKRKSGIRTCNVKTTRRLYTNPSMKRVLVFPNGESIERAQYVWGESLEQLLDNSNTRLSLRKPAKHIFTIEGIQVHDIGELERDQLVCAAPTKQFLLPKEGHQQIEVKANWGRARKKYGPHATEIIVTSKKNDSIDVDPFGPSALAGGPTKPRRDAYPSTHKR